MGCTGHIKLSRIHGFDERVVRNAVFEHLQSLRREYGEVVLCCGLAYGSDSLFAEEAIDCGVKLCVVLPCPANEFAAEQPDGGELFNRLFARAESVVLAVDSVNRYEGISRYIVEHCDELLAIWDGRELPLTDENGRGINRGGTYHTILLAKERGKVVRIFN